MIAGMQPLPSTATLRCGAALSTVPETREAVHEVCSQASAQLGAAPNLALAFMSHHHGPHFGRVAERICDAVGTECLLGCTGESIVGNQHEVEGDAALALWLAHLPGVSIVPMHLEFERTPEEGSFLGWPDELADAWPAESSLLLLGEPYSFPADALLERLNEGRPGVPVLGGMASGGWNPGQNRLLFGRRELERGAVGALIHGPVRLRSVVSQGCRPIGRPFVVTKADRNVILELSGKPAMAQLGELWPSLTAAEQKSAQGGLHVGCVINEYQAQFGRGDFLIRNVVGADPDAGAIAIGDYVRVGQTVQFHIRDAQSADEDFRELLTAAKHDATAPPAGALVFTCNGRGTRLFSEPHHDAQAIAEIFDNVPTAGFFAQGEIGPVGGKNFLHGFTASVVLFEPQQPEGTKEP